MTRNVFVRIMISLNYLVLWAVLLYSFINVFSSRQFVFSTKLSQLVIIMPSISLRIW